MKRLPSLWTTVALNARFDQLPVETDGVLIGVGRSRIGIDPHVGRGIGDPRDISESTGRGIVEGLDDVGEARMNSDRLAREDTLVEPPVARAHHRAPVVRQL